jgi:ribosomal-protein-alanine N-acetyltransferase
VSTTQLQTKRLKLVALTIEEVFAMVDSMDASEKAQLSADWLAKLHSATVADPWLHGFSIIQRDSGETVGTAGFKGPPSADGTVEIAYGIEPDYQGNGYATEAAQALVNYAFTNGPVSIVVAHTLPQLNASGGVLTKCGFQRVGEVVDPEDGLVWRWEKRHESTH